MVRQDPVRWLNDYPHNGYLVVEDCVDAESLAKLRQGAEKITAAPDTVPPHLTR